MKSLLTSIRTNTLNARVGLVIVLLFVAWFLFGCAGPQEVVVTKNKTQILEIPRNLVAKCAVTPPPYSPDSFAALSAKQREDVLTTYSIVLIGDIDKCDGQIRQIVAFEAREKKNVEDAQNAPPK